MNPSLFTKLKSLIAIGLLNIIWACGSASYGPDDEFNEGDTPPACQSHNSCGLNQACYLGRCITVNEISPIDIRLQISPSNASFSLKQFIKNPMQGVAAGAAVSLQLQAARRLYGEVISEQTNAGLGNFSVSQDQSSLGVRFDTRTELGAFELDVIDADYQVMFSPEDSSLPPFAAGPLSITGTDLEFDIEYPQASSLKTIQGVLRWKDSVDSGIEGARVSISSGIQSSTSVLTGADGSFSVVIASSQSTIDLEIRPGENLDVPAISQMGLELLSGNTLAPIVLNENPPGFASFSLRDQAGVLPVEGAVVNFLAEWTSPAGAELSHLVKTTTNANGVCLRDGSPPRLLAERAYRAQVSPPLSSPYALSEIELVTQEAGQTNEVLNVVERVSASGTVVDSNNRPLSGARIIFTHLLAGFNRQFEGVTDFDGRYAIQIDSSQGGDWNYEAQVIPPEELGLGRYIVDIVAPPSDAVWDISLEPSTFIWGTVNTALGQAETSSTISAFGVTNSGRVVILGISSSTDDGSFAIPVSSANSTFSEFSDFGL